MNSVVAPSHLGVGVGPRGTFAQVLREQPRQDREPGTALGGDTWRSEQSPGFRTDAEVGSK